jgi:hypothetical protein
MSRLPDRNRILPDVLLDGGAVRAAADVVERLSVLDPVFLAQGPAAGEDELAESLGSSVG